jgi:hypothetical protein
MAWGIIRIDRELRWIGWGLVIAGLLLDVLAGASGVIGCLPWDWWQCLHDGQEHSQNQIFHSGRTLPLYMLSEKIAESVAGVYR